MSNPAASPFRSFQVTAKVRESETITSFFLTPIDGKDWCDFEAGQFLTLRVPTGNGLTVLRNYTISSPPRVKGHYRITVKREAGAGGGLPPGLCSTWLHDTVEPGTILEIAPPRGAFTLDRLSSRPVILLSGGVGLTPMVSMLDLLVHESDRKVWFIHACENRHVQALAEEVEQLAAKRPGVTLHTCYREAAPGEASTTLPRYSSGLLSRETLQALLPLDDYDVYLCGPPPFMQALYTLLLGLGIRKERIAYEFFGPASLLSEGPPDPKPAIEPSATMEAIGSDAISVVLRRSGREFAWDTASPSLLTFLEDHGLDPAFSCRAGVCGTCEQSILGGKVDYDEEPLEPPPEGRILLCCTRPVSSIVLDL